jgi:ketosteroid isomerase-like protein
MSVAEIDTPKKRLEYIFGETSRRNGQAFLDALAENAEWTVIGSTGWSKTYRGKAAILSDLIAPLRRVLAPPRKSHALYMIAEGNMVAVQAGGASQSCGG